MFVAPIGAHHGEDRSTIDDGDDSAAHQTYDELWGRLRLPMLQLAVLLVDRHDIAEEVVQDAFVALHRHWDDVDAPIAYLRRSVVNGCRSVLRRRRLARLHLASTLDVPVAGADSPVLVAEEHREVVAALRTLPRRQREVLVLRYWNEMDDDTIAETLGISASNVRSTATRARQQLARQLEDVVSDLDIRISRALHAVADEVARTDARTIRDARIDAPPAPQAPVRLQARPQPSRRPMHWTVPASAAALVAGIVIVIALLVSGGGSRDVQPGGPGPTSPPVPSTTTGSTTLPSSPASSPAPSIASTTTGSVGSSASDGATVQLSTPPR